MSKRYVCLPLSETNIIAELTLLAASCECDVEIVGGEVAKTLIELQLADCDGIIVILKQPLSELNAIEPTILLANKLGKKIVCVWPPRSQSPVVPQVLEKYGAALLPWDSKKLCAAICEDEFEWVDAAGGARAGSKTKRHKC